MSKTVLTVAASLVVAALMAGCVDGDKPTDYRASGSNGKATVGYAPDGNGVQPFDGYITIKANDRSNSGEIHAEGTWDGATWVVHFDRFSGSKDFQDGGIASQLFEHGATGVADTSIPRVFVDLAAWGTATVTKDGEPLLDPLTEDARLAAHVMVIETGVRDDRTDAMYTDANKIKFYNPKNPEQGYADANDTEIHLVLKSSGTPPNETQEFGVPEQTINTVPVVPGTTQPNQYSTTHDLIENQYLGTVIEFTVDFEGDPNLYFSKVQLTVKAPSGDIVAQTPAGESMSSTQSVPFRFPAGEIGLYTLEVVGDGNGATYTVTGEAQPPDVIVWNFWFEDVMIGSLDATAAAGGEAMEDHGDDEQMDG